MAWLCAGCWEGERVKVKGKARGPDAVLHPRRPQGRRKAVAGPGSTASRQLAGKARQAGTWARKVLQREGTASALRRENWSWGRTAAWEEGRRILRGTWAVTVSVLPSPWHEQSPWRRETALIKRRASSLMSRTSVLANQWVLNGCTACRAPGHQLDETRLPRQGPGRRRRARR